MNEQTVPDEYKGYLRLVDTLTGCTYPVGGGATIEAMNAIATFMTVKIGHVFIVQMHDDRFGWIDPNTYDVRVRYWNLAQEQVERLV